MATYFNPSIVLSCLLIVAYASIFHLWVGRSLRELLVYLLAATAGFGLGQWVGTVLSMDVIRIGPLYPVESTIGTLVLLLLVKMVYL